MLIAGIPRRKYTSRWDPGVLSRLGLPSELLVLLQSGVPPTPHRSPECDNPIWPPCDSPGSAGGGFTYDPVSGVDDDFV